MTRAVVVPIGRPTFDLEQAAGEVAVAWSLLEADGVEVGGEQTIVTEVTTLDDRLDRFLPTAPDLLVVLQATFSDSSRAITSAP